MDFDPTLGHEQSGYRPALVISNKSFDSASNMTYVCPITNTFRNSPLHIKIENHLTTGYIMCDQLRSVDLSIRKIAFVEEIDPRLLREAIFVIGKSTRIN
jgi:mRNA interferase MazF